MAPELYFSGASVVVTTGLFIALAGGAEHAGLIAFFGRFHPLAVHLPIGIGLLVGLLEALSIAPSLRPRTDAAMSIILRLALLTAVIAFALGLMLASGGGYPERLLRLHQRLAYGTVLTFAVSVVVWSLHTKQRVPRLAHRLAVGSTLALLGIGAHFGGSMTHGESYLVEYAPTFVKRWLADPAPPPVEFASAALPNEARVFDDVVLPVLKQKCAGCHGGQIAKGQLRLDSFSALMKGGKGGPAVAAGDAKRSLLQRRIEVPISDDGHMPPQGKPQLTADEVELIASWIDGGASATTQLRETLVSDGARRLLLAAASRANEHDRADAGAPTLSGDAGAPTPAAPTEAPSPPAQSPNDDAGVRDRIAPPAPSTRATPTPKPTALASVPSALRPNATADAGAVARPVPLSDRAQAILVARCGSCHSGADPAGGLVVRDRDTLVARTYVIPGRPDASPLFSRLILPPEDDDHMPPMRSPQPSRAEIDVLRQWIQRGASVSAPSPSVSRP